MVFFTLTPPSQAPSVSALQFPGEGTPCPGPGGQCAAQTSAPVAWVPGRQVWVPRGPPLPLRPGQTRILFRSEQGPGSGPSRRAGQCHAGPRGVRALLRALRTGWPPPASATRGRRGPRNPVLHGRTPPGALQPQLPEPNLRLEGGCRGLRGGNGRARQGALRRRRGAGAAWTSRAAVRAIKGAARALAFFPGGGSGRGGCVHGGSARPRGPRPRLHPPAEVPADLEPPGGAPRGEEAGTVREPSPPVRPRGGLAPGSRAARRAPGRVPPCLPSDAPARDLQSPLQGARLPEAEPREGSWGPG